MVFSFRLFARLLGTGATEVGYVPICRCLRHPQYKPIFKLELCPPMASGLLNGGSGDFGTSPFLGSSSDKSLLPTNYTWGAGTKAQWRVDKLIRGWGYRARLNSSGPAGCARPWPRRRARRRRRTYHPSANSYTAMRRGAVHGVGAPRDTRRSPNPRSRRVADMGATALAGSPSDFAKESLTRPRSGRRWSSSQELSRADRHARFGSDSSAPSTSLGARIRGRG